MKTLKHIKAVIALELVIVMAALTPMHAFAAANNGKYVSEVFVAYGKETEDAKKTLEDKGFTPVEGNLNDGGDTYAMLGYKTTNNIRDSITDLAVMNMNGGYSVENYKNFLKSQKSDIVEFLEEFMAVIQEYRRNLKKERSKAIIVHDLLNTFVDDDTKMKMGDLLYSETLQDRVGITNSVDAENPENLPNLVTILFQGNAQILKTMEILLSMAADTNENTWLERFARTDYDALLDEVENERPELNTESKRAAYLDNTYSGSAFAIGLAVGALREKLLDYENGDLHIDTATEEDIKAAFGDVKQLQNSEELQSNMEYNDWLSIATIYEGLKAFEGGNYEAGDMLELFLEENDPEDSELFIPMAAALSEGQRAGLPFVSFEMLMEYTFSDEEGWAEQAAKIKKGFSNREAVSVYDKIDRGIYEEDGTVALTDAAQRDQNVETIGTDGNHVGSDSLAAITQICYVATALATIASVCAVKLKNATVEDAASMANEVLDEMYGVDGYERWNEDLYQAIFDDDAYDSYLVNHASEIADIEALDSARFAVMLSKIIYAITVFIAVITTITTILDLLRDKRAEQLPIPKYMVDNYTASDGGSYTLNYKAVECNREEFFGADYSIQTGSSADLLADEGSQWLALYASKNSKAGRPITPDFVIQKDSKAPSEYDGNIHLFGEKGAVNTVGSAFKLYSGASQMYQGFTNRYKVYIFYKLSNDIKTYDEASGNMTASALGKGNMAIIGVGGVVIGLVIGALFATFVNKNKKKKENG